MRGGPKSLTGFFIILFCSIGNAKAISPSQVQLDFQSFLKSYKKQSASYVNADQKRAQDKRNGELNQDVFQSEFSATPRLSHQIRDFELDPRKISVRNQLLDISYNQQLPTGTSLGLNAQTNFEKAEPQLSFLRQQQSVTLNQDIYNNGFGYAQRRRAERGRVGNNIADMEFRVASLSVCEEAFDLYADAFIQQEKVNVLKSEMSDADEAFKIAKRLFRNRLVHKVDFLSSESDYINSKMQFDEAVQLLANNKRRMAVFTAQPTNQYSLRSPENFVAKVPKKNWAAKTLDQEIAEKQLKSAELRMDEVASQTRMDVDLALEVGHREGRGFDVRNGGIDEYQEDFVTANLIFKLPVINKTNDANYSQAVANHTNQAINKARVDKAQPAFLQNLYEMETLLSSQVERSSTRVKLLDEKAKAAFRQMRSGKMDFENYLLHRNAFRVQQLRHLDLQKQMWMNRFAIKRESAQLMGQFCGDQS